MEILVDCIQGLWSEGKPKIHCPHLSIEMAALLEEIMYLFRDNHSDLRKIFEFREDEISTCVVDMEKCTLDLREIIESCLSDEESRLESIKSHTNQILELKTRNSDLQNSLSSLQTQLSSAHNQIKVLDRENRELIKDVDQQKYEIDRLYQDLSEIPKLQSRLDNLKKELTDSDYRLGDTIRVSRELEADHDSLMRHNQELVRQADEEHQEVRRLQTLEEDAKQRIKAVISCETS